MGKMYDKGMIFGVFDLLHDGHLFFIEKACNLCEKLTIVVAKDKEVVKIKNKTPLQDENLRVLNLKNKFKNIDIILGDENTNSWNIIEKEKPDAIILGYDQEKLLSPLLEIQKKYNFKIEKIKEDYFGDTFHTSLLH